MDIFAHALWTNVAFQKKDPNSPKPRLWAVFFGIFPDLVSFTPATIYAFFHFGGNYMQQLLGSTSWVFVWAKESYNYTHSFITFLLVFFVVYGLRKGKPYWPLLGWALHIAIDIFSHKGFYETPFLYPLSNYKFDHGTSWGNPTFMFINYGLLAIVYIGLIYYYKGPHAKKT